MLAKIIHIDNSVIMRYCEKIFLYFSPVTLAVIIMIATWIVNYRRKRSRLVALMNKIPGPPALPIIGEFLLFIQYYIRSLAV